MSHLKYKLDRVTLETIYKSYIRPVLEYGAVVWDNCTEGQSDQIELIQKRAGRIITGAIIRTRTASIYRELGWTSLKERRKISRLCQMHKIVNSDAPSYLVDTLPIMVGDQSCYPILRDRKNISKMRSRLTLYEGSFFPKTISEYNNLNSTTRNIINNKAFKDAVKTKIETPKPWFYVGDRRKSIVHSRLRMNCSQLSYDLYALGIINNPSCLCGHVREDATHFLLFCPLYNQQRRKLFNIFDNIGFGKNVSNILHGNSESDRASNIKATLAIHDFFRSSGRFD